MKFTYLAQPPKKYTFQQPKLKIWVEKQCKGKTLNLFAGMTKLNINEVRVDNDENAIADYYMDALEFIDFAEKRKMKFNTVILDPPYTFRKSKEKYNGGYVGSFPKLRNMLLSILSEKAIIITLGYDTVGMSKSRGFKKIAICIVCHNGDSKDTLCLVEERYSCPKHYA